MDKRQKVRDIMNDLRRGNIGWVKAQDEICALLDVVGRSEQLPDANKNQCNCSNAQDRLDCGFECYNK